MIDIAIIGGGPGGLSAAINGAARGRRCVVFSRDETTGMLYKAEKVNNYLGLPGRSGGEMVDTFLAHAKEMGVEIKTGRVLQVLPIGDTFGINFENDIYEAKTLIIATGIQKGKKIPGEEAFLGRGLSYCATCDGMLYRNKDVVIAGEIKEGEADAAFLAGVARSVVYLPYYKDIGPVPGNVKVIQGRIKAVEGGDKVAHVVLDTGQNLPCDGVFFVKAATPLDTLLQDIAMEEGAIQVDRLMQTNIPGVFAAGDCTGWPYQVSNAVGEGLVAAQQADRYLHRQSREG